MIQMLHVNFHEVREDTLGISNIHIASKEKTEN